jgi:hypothetical protein
VAEGSTVIDPDLASVLAEELSKDTVRGDPASEIS